MQPILTALLVFLAPPPAPLPDEVEVSLRGSPESMVRQHRVAVEGGYTFTGTLDEMELLAGEGHLVPIPGGPDYEVMDWVFPYGLPEVRTFVERFASQYRQACGERLVVTSLTRPFTEQLPNSHQLSVHPAGMAVDLRISQNAACREFLESTLLAKEEAGLLDITRERAPPHYHIALFPTAYAEWVTAQPPEQRPALPPEAAVAEQTRYTADATGASRGRAAALLMIALLAGLAAAYGIRSRLGTRRPPPAA